MTPRSARVSVRRFRRILAWTRRAVWLMAWPVTPWASRITGPACRATRSCMRRASLADWLCRLSAAASWPRARAATALAGVSGGTTIRVPSASRCAMWSGGWAGRHGRLRDRAGAGESDRAAVFQVEQGPALGGRPHPTPDRAPQQGERVRQGGQTGLGDLLGLELQTGQRLVADLPAVEQEPDAPRPSLPRP